jgi:hypothetical protein
MELEIDAGHARHAAYVNVEVEFYLAYPAIEPTRDEPGEPAQYEVAAIRPYEYHRIAETGMMDTTRHYLETPPWLADLLFDCIDEDRLADMVLR